MSGLPLDLSTTLTRTLSFLGSLTICVSSPDTVGQARGPQQADRGLRRLHGGGPERDSRAQAGPGRQPGRRPEAQRTDGRGGEGHAQKALDSAVAGTLQAARASLDNGLPGGPGGDVLQGKRHQFSPTAQPCRALIDCQTG